MRIDVRGGPHMRQIRTTSMAYSLASRFNSPTTQGANMSTATESDATLGASMYELFRDVRDTYETDTRHEVRYAFLRTVTLRVGDQLRAGFSREISRTGIGFLHNFEMPLEEIEASIPTDQGNDVRIHVQIRWKQSVGAGWYISGGDFVEIPDICA
jgi:hypothetical protein